MCRVLVVKGDGEKRVRRVDGAKFKWNAVDATGQPLQGSCGALRYVCMYFSTAWMCWIKRITARPGRRTRDTRPASLFIYYLKDLGAKGVCPVYLALSRIPSRLCVNSVLAGSSGDGATDDTAAVQAALKASNPGN